MNCQISIGMKITVSQVVSNNQNNIRLINHCFDLLFRRSGRNGQQSHQKRRNFMESQSGHFDFFLLLYKDINDRLKKPLGAVIEPDKRGNVFTPDSGINLENYFFNSRPTIPLRKSMYCSDQYQSRFVCLRKPDSAE